MTTTPMQDDAKLPALKRAIGSVLRAGRRAAEISANHGTHEDIAACAREIRAAADRALRLCECAGEQT